MPPSPDGAEHSNVIYWIISRHIIHWCAVVNLTALHEIGNKSAPIVGLPSVLFDKTYTTLRVYKVHSELQAASEALSDT